MGYTHITVVLLGLVVFTAADSWRCDQLTNLVDVLHSYRDGSLFVEKAFSDIELSTQLLLDEPQNRRRLACLIAEAGPSMRNISLSLNIPYFKIRHYSRFLQNHFEIEHPSQWETVSHVLNGQKLLWEQAFGWLQLSGFPDVQLKRLEVEKFVSTLQRAFGSSSFQISQRMNSLDAFLKNTPDGFADAVADTNDIDELNMRLNGSIFDLVYIAESSSRTPYMDLYDAIAVALDLGILPLQDDGDVTMPSTNDESCRDILQYLIDYFTAEADVASLYEFTYARIQFDAHVWRDTLEPVFIEQAACALAGAHGLEALAGLLMTPLSVVTESRDEFMDHQVQREMDGEETISTRSRILPSVVDFLETSDFPSFPLDVTRDRVIDFLNLLRANTVLVLRIVFPVETMNNDELADLLINSQSLDEYMAATDIDVGDRQYLIHNLLGDTKQQWYRNNLVHRGIAIARSQGWLE